jgi:hypothetical protein
MHTQQSTKPPIRPPSDQPAKQSTCKAKPINHSAQQPANQQTPPASQSASQPINQSTHQSIQQPSHQSRSQPSSNPEQQPSFAYLRGFELHAQARAD